MNDPKETNPKDAVGVRKVAFSVIPFGVIARIALALLEGARKYGRHNWRDASARASTYFDGTLRHLVDWYEGTDIDPDSGLNHIDKALASLTVLRDAMLASRFVDDRPPRVYPEGWLQSENVVASNIIDKYPDAKTPHMEVARPLTVGRAKAPASRDAQQLPPKQEQPHPVKGVEDVNQFYGGKQCPFHGTVCKLISCGNGKCWARDSRPRIPNIDVV